MVADNTMLTTIVSLERLYVYFYVDERTLLHLAKRRRRRRQRPTVRPSVIFADIGLAYEEGYSLKGSINFEDNKVDAGTGTKLMRAELKNSKAAAGKWLLSPGLFARIRLPIGNPKQAVLVADRALSTDQGKKFIFVIVDKADPNTGKVGPTVERRYIQAGVCTAAYARFCKGLATNPCPPTRGSLPRNASWSAACNASNPGFRCNPRMCPMPGAK